jgi:uncharacterized membrane protein YphA (DoxX/SURF4 family)
MIDKMGSGFKDYAPFVLRLGLATIFIIQGAREVTYHGSSVEHLIPGAIELLGGLFFLIGFMTRWAGAALMGLMAWEIFQHYGLRAFTEPGHQLYFAAFVMSFALFGLGGGKWSVDAQNKKKEQ